jgi:hypothetical protein
MRSSPEAIVVCARENANAREPRRGLRGAGVRSRALALAPERRLGVGHACGWERSARGKEVAHA